MIRLGNNEVLKTLTNTLTFVDANAGGSTIALPECCSGELKTTDEPPLTHSKEFLQNESSDSKHHGTSDDNKLTQSENSSDDLGKLSEEGALRYDSSEKETDMSNNCESESLIHNFMAEISTSFSSGEEENTTENLPEINIPIVKSIFCLFVLRFYGPVNPMGSCQARSVYLTTRLLAGLVL